MGGCMDDVSQGQISFSGKRKGYGRLDICHSFWHPANSFVFWEILHLLRLAIPPQRFTRPDYCFPCLPYIQGMSK